MKVYENNCGTVKIRQNQTEDEPDVLVDYFLEELQHIQKYMPILSSLGTPEMKERHWDQIFSHLQKHQKPATFSFTELLHMNIMDKKEVIEQISSRAQGEGLIEQ
jgi:dynein heavy chain